MKRVLIATTAAVIALSGAASAMTNASDHLERQVQEYVPTADLSGYSEGAISQIRSILDDNENASFASVKSQLTGALNVYK